MLLSKLDNILLLSLDMYTDLVIVLLQIQIIILVEFICCERTQSETFECDG